MNNVVQIDWIESRETFWRSLQTLSVTRVLIAIVLLGYLSFNNKQLWGAGQFIYGEICIAYLLLAFGFAVLAGYYRRRFLLQLLSQITADICVISMLYVVAGGAKSGLAILFLLPLAGSAILAPLMVALFFVSVVTLFLLAESAYQIFILVANVPILQSALYGAAFFTTVLVVNRLAAKLIRQEALAVQRGKDLQVQQAINLLVIADVGDGILVLGRDSTVFTANPAAQAMLGLMEPDRQVMYRLSDVLAMSPIADAFFAWMTHAQADGAMTAAESIYVTVKLRDDIAAPSVPAVWSGRRELVIHLKLRFVKVETSALGMERSVVFLQDVSEIENQAQQLKLASMGRLTASIAHEVRNPLSAISHAAALLSEDLSGATQLRLVNIIGDNVTRVNRMIEDILKLSRKVLAHGEPMALAPFLGEILVEFQETHSLSEQILVLGDGGSACVRFDPSHLREVVVNLLSNAVRYASGQNGSIRIQPVSDGVNRLELHVQDDGPGISPEVRAHLFEPFYTTSSKGTGLGLYLAREMCLNNDAMLDYEYRIETGADGAEQASGRFVITFTKLD
jgi:two-component system sensor histidine kinase PilS (NtrC family)